VASASLAVTLGICSPASAQNLTDAKKLFDEGEKAEQSGDCRTAVEKWKGVLVIKETPQVHLRIGRCQESLGHLSGAITAYERAVELAGGNAQVLDVANQQLKALEPRVPMLTLKWDGGISGASVQLDGQPVATNGQAVRVDPGAHTIDATAPDRAPFKKTLELAEAARETIRITLEPTTVAPTPTVPEEGGPSLSPWPFVLMGGGVVAAGIAIPLAVVGVSDLDEVYTHCTDSDSGKVCPPQYEDDISGVKLKYGVAGALGAVSAIALGVGVTWLVLDLTSTPEEPKPQALLFAPWASPDGAGLVVGGPL
jgi:hypothetical protein